MSGAVTPGPEADKTVTRVKVLEEQLKGAQLNKWLRIGAAVILLVTLISTLIGIVQYQRLASCGARTIEVAERRNSYTAELRSLTDRDQENLRTLIEKITSPQGQNPQSVAQALQDYKDEADQIKAQRIDIRTQQDQYEFPSLEDCD